MEDNGYSCNGRNIICNGKILLTAEADIKLFLLLGNIIVVLVSGQMLSHDRNIFGYDLSGKFKWQIPNPPKIVSRNYYSSIYLSDDKKLMGYSINGVEVAINEENGVIIKKELIK
jgi:hypothetical protein